MGTRTIANSTAPGNTGDTLAPIRHPIGSEVELRLWRGADHGQPYVECRLFRRPVEEVGRSLDAFKPTDAGLRIPAHLVSAVSLDLSRLLDGADTSEAAA